MRGAFANCWRRNNPKNAVEPLIFTDGHGYKQSCAMEALHPVSEGEFHPIDPDLFDQCLLALISGYSFYGI